MPQHDTSRQMKTKTTSQQYFGMSCHIVSSSIQVPASPLKKDARYKCIARLVFAIFPARQSVKTNIQ